MGEAAAAKVTEIEATRDRLEGDLKELEERIPSPLRSIKAIVGGLVTTTGGLSVLKKVLSRKKKENDRKTEVVIRVLRDDVEVERRR